MRHGMRLMAAAGLALASGGALQAAIPPGLRTVSIERIVADAGLDRATPAFVDAVSAAFEGRGVTPIRQAGHAQLVVELDLDRADTGMGTAQGPVAGSTVTPGGAPGGVGVGVGVTLPTAKSHLVALERTRLEIRIRRRGDDTVLWHGAATTVRANDTPPGRDEAVAADLAEAILRDYPAEPAGLISVP